MKQMNLAIDPMWLSDVRAQLETAGVRRFSIREARSVGPWPARELVYRGAKYTLDEVAELELTFLLEDAPAEALLLAFEEHAGVRSAVVCTVDRVLWRIPHETRRTGSPLAAKAVLAPPVTAGGDSMAPIDSCS